MMMIIKMMLLLLLVSVASVSWSASHFLLNKAAAQEHFDADQVTPSSDQQPPDKTNGNGDQTQQKQTQRRKL